MKNLDSFLPHDVRRFGCALARPKWYANIQRMRATDGDIAYKQFIDTKSIFIHIPKAAGISICHSLYGNRAGGHDCIAKYEVIFSRSEFNRFFKFTFVRNPWERLYSAYTFLSQGGINEADAWFAESVLSRFASFEDFVLRWVNPENVLSYIHFVPQTNLLRSYTGKPLAVDFIGRYENIQADFEHIKSRLNLTAELPHLNKTKGAADYRAFYSKEMIDIVSEAYRTDVDLLRYSFDPLMT